MRFHRLRRAAARLLAGVLAVAMLAGLLVLDASVARAVASACDGLTVTIAGTNDGDVLTGTALRDVIAGGNGDDVIEGMGGDDVLCGGNGKDVVDGGPGNDRVDGGEGTDTLNGEAGADSVTGDNGPDLLDGGSGNDLLDGGNGPDVCTAGPRFVACETEVDEEPRPDEPGLDDLMGPAPAGTVTARGLDGVEVVIESNGGIRPQDVFVGVDPVLTRRTADAMASPAYDIELLTDDAPAFTRATLTLPYRAELLGGFPEQDLRIHHFDEELGLWVPAGDGQVVDAAADTVTVEVEHFSIYAVFKLDDRGWARYWASTPARCVAAGSPGDPGAIPLDVAFSIDSSGSMSWNDPSNVRLTATKAVIDQLAAASATDRVAVVDFDDSARLLAALTLLDPAGVTALKAAVDRIDASGGTNIAAGVSTGIGALTDPARVVAGRARVLVLLTDGDGFYDANLTQRAASEGIIVHTVGLGSAVNETLLAAIASGTGGRYFQVADADDLVAAFRTIGAIIRDDGTDSDADGLTDCEEVNGMLSTWGIYDTSLDPTENDPFLGDRWVTSDPHDADTDGDGLTDGQEMRGGTPGALRDPLDLRDFEATREQYGFLIEAGITKYFVMRSDPNVVDSDADGLTDREETEGVVSPANGETYTSRPDRWDTDFDGASDWVEIQAGTDPRMPDPGELGIPGLDRYTLFQREEYGEAPVVGLRWVVTSDRVHPIIYNSTPVLYDADWNCVSNCDAVRAYAEDLAPDDWCWVPWVNCSVDDKVREVVRAAVEAQGIFNEDGSFKGEFVEGEAAVECATTHDTPSECNDPDLYDHIDESVDAGDDFDQVVAEVLMNLPGGYRPKDLCGGPDTPGGTYRLKDPATGQTRYVGQTNDLARRQTEHAADPRYRDLDFEVAARTDNYQVRRGLEQRAYNDTWGDVPISQAQAAGSLNGQRPMATTNRAYDWRLELAQLFFDLCT